MGFKVGDLAKFKDDAYDNSAFNGGISFLSKDGKHYIEIPRSEVNGALVEIVWLNETLTHADVVIVATGCKRGIQLNNRLEELKQTLK
jgi:hypothetical protein